MLIRYIVGGRVFVWYRFRIWISLVVRWKAFLLKRWAILVVIFTAPLTLTCGLINSWGFRSTNLLNNFLCCFPCSNLSQIIQRALAIICVFDIFTGLCQFLFELLQLDLKIVLRLSFYIELKKLRQSKIRSSIFIRL
jgi:hypothetical protein